MGDFIQLGIGRWLHIMAAVAIRTDHLFFATFRARVARQMRLHMAPFAG